MDDTSIANVTQLFSPSQSPVLKLQFSLSRSLPLALLGGEEKESQTTCPSLQVQRLQKTQTLDGKLRCSLPETLMMYLEHWRTSWVCSRLIYSARRFAVLPPECNGLIGRETAEIRTFHVDLEEV